MLCLLLAAGYATRLYPLTENFPKPLLDIGGKTILDWLVDDVDGCGEIARYAVVTNHRYAERFRRWAGGKRLSALVDVLDDGSETNETRLGAVRDMLFARDALAPSLANDDWLVLAGDNVLDFSLRAFIDYARRRDAVCVMRYREDDVEKLKKTGVAQVDAVDRITRMEEKPPKPFAHWCTPPFYYIPRRVLPDIRSAVDAGCGVDAPGSLIAWLSARTPTYAMLMPGRRYDVGTLESYERIRASYRGIGGA